MFVLIWHEGYEHKVSLHKDLASAKRVIFKEGKVKHAAVMKRKRVPGWARNGSLDNLFFCASLIGALIFECGIGPGKEIDLDSKRVRNAA